jgi:hypothetical protein
MGLTGARCVQESCQTEFKKKVFLDVNLYMKSVVSEVKVILKGGNETSKSSGM